MTNQAIREEDVHCFADVFENLNPAFPRESQTAGSYGFTLIRINQESHEKYVPPVSDIVLRLVVGGALTSSSVDYGDGPIALSGKKGSFYVAPADAGAQWRSEGTHELLMLAVDRPRVHELLSFGGEISQDDPLRALYGRDIFNATLANFLDGIWRECSRGGPGEALMVDGLFMAMLGTLARLSSEGERPEKQARPPRLDARLIARVADYVDANLGRTIVIRELAEIACLSPFHFSRCFREAAGVSPHRFVTERRIDASKRMLGDPTIALAQVAFACGFSSQSHFNRVFRQFVGASPGAYRAEISA